jgi:hypothetical protein
MRNTTFRLSRIYAEGWNAAQALPTNESDRLEERDVPALSPYATEPERSRWSEGFAKALWN